MEQVVQFLGGVKSRRSSGRKSGDSEDVAQLRAERQEIIDLIWGRSGVPAMQRGFRLGTSPVPRLARRLGKTLAGSWFLYGPPGQGKTGLAIGYLWAYLNARMDAWGQPPSILFVTLPGLLQAFRDSYKRSDLAERQIVGDCLRVQLLVLDDLGAEHVRDTGWAEDRLYQIVGGRHAAGSETFFTSNLSLEAITDYLGERLAWRILEMVGSKNVVEVRR